MPSSTLKALAKIPATVELEAAPAAVLQAQEPGEDGQREPRRVRMEAYSGGVFDIGFGPAVIDLAGLELPDPEEGMPLLRQHNFELFVGRSDDIEKGEAGLVVLGHLFDGVPEAEQVARISDQGGQWQSSVGIKIDFERIQFVDDGLSVEANGRTFDGPLILLAGTELREASFVPLGADPNTSAVALDDTQVNQLAQEAQETMDEKERIAALSAEFAERPAFALKAINRGWSLEDAKERAAELDAALAERDQAHAAELAAKDEAHVAELEAAKKVPAPKPSAAAVLSGFDSAGTLPDDDGTPESTWEQFVAQEEARLSKQNHPGARRAGLRLASTVRGRLANVRALAVANVANKHPDIHKAYLSAYNSGAKRRGR